MNDRTLQLPPVNRQELAAILAGLRLYEALYPLLAEAVEPFEQDPDDPAPDPVCLREAIGDSAYSHEGSTDCAAIVDVATDGGSLDAMAWTQIDDLCGYVNAPQRPAPATSDLLDLAKNVGGQDDWFERSADVNLLRATLREFRDQARAANPVDAPVTLAIIVEGGLIQAIVSDNPAAFKGVTVKVIDYDSEEDRGATHLVPQEDGHFERAYVYEETVSLATIALNDIGLESDAVPLDGSERDGYPAHPAENVEDAENGEGEAPQAPKEGPAASG